MDSLLITAAKSALTIETGIPELDLQPNKNLNGRTAVPWSYKVFVAGSIVGVIAALAALAFQAYFLLALAIILALTNAFAALYVKRFHTLKTLETYTQALAEKVKLIANGIIDLKKANDELEKVCSGIKTLPENWQKEIENTGKLLKEKISQLAEAQEKLELAQSRLEKFATVTQELQNQTGKLSQAALEFSKENEFLGDHVSNLEEHVKTLDKEGTGLKEDIIKLDVQNDQSEKILNIYSRQNKMLDEQFNLMKSMYLSAKQEVGTLKEEIKTLKLESQKLQKSVNKVEEVEKKYEIMSQSLEKKLTELKNLKAKSDKWQNFKKSTFYKPYIESLKKINN